MKRAVISHSKRAAIAFMLADNHSRNTQDRIAKKIGISQSAVAKIAAELAKQQIIETAVNEARLIEDLGKPAVEAGKRLAHASPLVEKLEKLGETLGISAPTVATFPAFAQGDDGSQWERRAAEFSRNAAPYALRLLERSQLVGVTWGGTLGRLVEAIENVKSPIRANKPLRVIPVSGDPGSPRGNRYSSTPLAERLERALNGEVRQPLSLALLPAFLPIELTKLELKTMHKVIGRMPGYREIFGNHLETGALVTQIDTIITSISSAEEPLGYGMGSLAEAAGLNTKELRELVEGDIGGVLLQRHTLNKRRQDKIDTFIQSWTGLSRNHLADCANKARKDNAAGLGCVVVAMGANKAKCLLAAIMENLVNHAIVDLELAAALEGLLP